VVRDVLTGTKVSSTEREFVAAMSGPERSFDLVRFPFTDFPESEVESFATANADFFTRLDLAVVTLATEEEAQQIREQALQPGNPMGDLARTYSRDLYADQDGQMGEIYGYELQQELINPEDLATVIALAPGEISDPVETTAGWAFYEMLSPPVAFDRADPDMIRTARTYMQNFELGRIQDYVTSEAERFAEVARGSDLAGAAAAEGFDVLSTPFFPINYGNNQLFGQLQSAQVPGSLGRSIPGKLLHDRLFPRRGRDQRAGCSPPVGAGDAASGRAGTPAPRMPSLFRSTTTCWFGSFRAMRSRAPSSMRNDSMTTLPSLSIGLFSESTDWDRITSRRDGNASPR
jgi:hypothetical protein